MSLSPVGFTRGEESVTSVNPKDGLTYGRPDIVSALPRPPYPYEARKRHDTGVVVTTVTFGPDGAVKKCESSRFSTSKAMVLYTCAFIVKTWKEPRFAGKTVTVPIEYGMVGYSGAGI